MAYYTAMPSVLYLSILHICVYVCAVAYRRQREPMSPCMLQESGQACVWVRRTQLWYQLWSGEGEMQGPHTHPRPQGPMQRSVDIRHFYVRIFENKWDILKCMWALYHFSDILHRMNVVLMWPLIINVIITLALPCDLHHQQHHNSSLVVSWDSKVFTGCAESSRLPGYFLPSVLRVLCILDILLFQCTI